MDYSIIKRGKNFKGGWLKDMAEEGSRRRVGGRVFRSFLMILIALLIFLAGFQAVKIATGTSMPLLVVVGPSMKNTLMDGDLVFIVHVDPEDLKVGDIIVFHPPTSPKGLVIHRIYSIEKQGDDYIFRTKGDNNLNPDPWKINGSLIEGRLLYTIPKVGIISRIISTPLNYLLITLLIIIIIVIDIKGYRGEG